ncbi:PIN domain nuclease [Nibricoccus aquaticus]|uniref:PIN domain nuclease n=1 Tax=Nibricoccus aquaticus TaxID=2576891 RepID=A0A290QL57_9BACT|nr:type II toxin-antitoxin system VapC family toxin [Nibricoccus aquaticus]ATC65141.1 PIN domain nuclease [Nibricoccus aquaticus]
MRLLLDSHVLIWWLENPDRIAKPLRDAISDPTNDVFFSAASIWELTIKSSLNRLRLPPSFVTLLRHDGLDELEINTSHAQATASLPPIHGDPFDRMLIAQALTEGLVLATRDATIMRYDVPVIEA